MSPSKSVWIYWAWGPELRSLFNNTKLLYLPNQCSSELTQNSPDILIFYLIYLKILNLQLASQIGAS